jgi:diguanylate cyclase (GGDEF)-like protein
MEAVMADAESRDHPADAMTASVRTEQQDGATTAVAAEERGTLVVGEWTRAESDQTLSDSDQTNADSDQTSADGDQTLSDVDQTNAESDQWASDRDQAASDRDLAWGVDPTAHEFSRDIRERGTRQREQSAGARVGAAGIRDATASSRDLAALARDDAAQARDIAMRQREAAYEQDDWARTANGADIVIRAGSERARTAELRAHVAELRELAARDRQSAARDRAQAAEERRQALLDRKALARQLENTAIDPLTGARARAAGLSELDHELERCVRTSGLLVVAYVDVVGLKTVNDGEGRCAGDELLIRVVAVIKEHLRSYDLIIRLGGDEFLCAMSNMTLANARQRFKPIAATLAAAPDAGAIRTGFAQLAADQTSSELIARADSEMIESHYGELGLTCRPACDGPGNVIMGR